MLMKQLTDIFIIIKIPYLKTKYFIHNQMTGRYNYTLLNAGKKVKWWEISQFSGIQKIATSSPHTIIGVHRCLEFSSSRSSFSQTWWQNSSALVVVVQGEYIFGAHNSLPNPSGYYLATLDVYLKTRDLKLRQTKYSSKTHDISATLTWRTQGSSTRARVQSRLLTMFLIEFQVIMLGFSSSALLAQN